MVRLLLAGLLVVAVLAIAGSAYAQHTYNLTQYQYTLQTRRSLCEDALTRRLAADRVLTTVVRPSEETGWQISQWRTTQDRARTQRVDADNDVRSWCQ